VSEINRQAGVAPVEVPKELANLVRRSIKVSALTDGAFDITFHTVGRLWNFKSRTAPVPAKEAIRPPSTTRATGTSSSTSRGRRSTSTGRERGSASAPSARATPPTAPSSSSRARRVTGGVSTPAATSSSSARRRTASRGASASPTRSTGKTFAWLDTTEQAVVTSGNYENYIEVDGRRLSHILDPRTGWPVEELRSVTIVCPDGELADALATGVSVLGVEKGLALVDRLNGVEAMVVDAAGTIHFSKGLEAMVTKAGHEK
jgi:FAD:protein FMN transferase